MKPTVMQRQALKDALAGGYIEAYELDLSRRAFNMRVDVLDDVLVTYEIKFEKMSRFLLEEELGGTWERVQLTDIWIEEEPEHSKTEEWQILISLWDLVHISIRCAAILVDGVPLR